MAPPPEAPSSAKSRFVSVIGWIFLVLSLIGILYSLARAFAYEVNPSAFMPLQPHERPPGYDRLSVVVQYVVDNLRTRVQFIVIGIYSAATLIASIGLLKRRNWGRILLIVVLVLGMLGWSGSLWLQESLWAAAYDRGPIAPLDTRSWMGTALTGLRLASAAYAITGIVVQFWILLCLISRRVRTEFNAL